MREIFEIGKPLLIYHRTWIHIGKVHSVSQHVLGLDPAFSPSSCALPDKPIFTLREFSLHDFDFVTDFLWDLKPPKAYFGLAFLVEAYSFPEEEFYSILNVLGARQ